nr:hypothetical protein [uncultured Allomuricauda sp.]
MNQIAYIKRTGIFWIGQHSSNMELLYGVAGSICYMVYVVLLIVDENRLWSIPFQKHAFFP